MLEAMRNRLSRPRGKVRPTPASPEPKLLRLLDDGMLDLTPAEELDLSETELRRRES